MRDSERIVREILTERGDQAGFNKLRGRERDWGHPGRGTACAKALRLKEHGSCMDHGRLTHNKHGTAQTTGIWPQWSKWCTVRASGKWVWLEKLEGQQRIR